MISCNAMVCEICLLLLDWTLLFFLVFGFGAWIELLVFLAFWFGFSFGQLFSVLDAGLDFWFSDFGFGFWVWILDWIFIWFLIKDRQVWIMPGKGWVALPERGKLTHSGRRVWTMLGKGPEWPGFGLGLRPCIINCYLQVVEYGQCSTRVRRDQDSA